MIIANWTTGIDVISDTISLMIVLAISFNSSFCNSGLVKSRGPFSQEVSSASPVALYFRSWLKFPLSF